MAETTSGSIPHLMSHFSSLFPSPPSKFPCFSAYSTQTLCQMKILRWQALVQLSFKGRRLEKKWVHRLLGSFCVSGMKKAPEEVQSLDDRCFYVVKTTEKQNSPLHAESWPHTRLLQRSYMISTTSTASCSAG